MENVSENITLPFTADILPDYPLGDLLPSEPVSQVPEVISGDKLVVVPVPETEPERNEEIFDLHILDEIKEENEKSSDTYNPSYNVVVESPEYKLSSNVTVSVNTESVSLDELIAAISRNQVSMNVSNNTLSSSYIQIVSMDNTPWFDKPFEQYTTSEGIQLTMMIGLCLGYLFTRLTKGVNINDL